jgi:hypothetical protein
MTEVTNNELKQGRKTKQPGASHPMYDRLAPLPLRVWLLFLTFGFWLLADGKISCALGSARSHGRTPRTSSSPGCTRHMATDGQPWRSSSPDGNNSRFCTYSHFFSLFFPLIMRSKLPGTAFVCVMRVHMCARVRVCAYVLVCICARAACFLEQTTQ